MLYNSSRSVPASYTYKVFGASFSSKSVNYLLSLLLVFAMPPNSIVSAVCGLAAGALYRANFLGSRQWRIPVWMQALGRKAIMPALATTRMPRRSTRATLDDAPSTGTPSAQPPRAATTARQGAISEVVQTLWVEFSLRQNPAETLLNLKCQYQSRIGALARGCRSATRDVSCCVLRTDQRCSAKGWKRCQSLGRVLVVGCRHEIAKSSLFNTV